MISVLKTPNKSENHTKVVLIADPRVLKIPVKENFEPLSTQFKNVRFSAK